MSESSLLVYPGRVIAKTCGTTDTLGMLAPMLELAAGVTHRLGIHTLLPPPLTQRLHGRGGRRGFRTVAEIVHRCVLP